MLYILNFLNRYFTNNFNNEFIEVNIKYNVKKCRSQFFFFYTKNKYYLLI